MGGSGSGAGGDTADDTAGDVGGRKDSPQQQTLQLLRQRQKVRLQSAESLNPPAAETVSTNYN